MPGLLGRPGGGLVRSALAAETARRRNRASRSCSSSSRSRTTTWPISPTTGPPNWACSPSGSSRAIEALPHIARAHVSRWGDGGAHLHVFFFARPAGFPQLRGTCLAIWDDLLPAVPAAHRDRDAAAVAGALAAHGGHAEATKTSG